MYFLKDNTVLRSVFYVCFASLILAMPISLLMIGDVKTPLIIHFDSYKGIDFLQSKFYVLGILGTALFITIINLILADEIYHKERTTSYILTIFTGVFTCLILIGIWVIINLN